MTWFIRFPLVAILGGMIGGPLSYWGGAQMKGLIFPQYWEMSLITLALLWGVSMALYIWITSHLGIRSSVKEKKMN